MQKVLPLALIGVLAYGGIRYVLDAPGGQYSGICPDLGLVVIDFDVTNDGNKLSGDIVLPLSAPLSLQLGRIQDKTVELTFEDEPVMPGQKSLASPVMFKGTIGRESIAGTLTRGDHQYNRMKLRRSNAGLIFRRLWFGQR